MTVSKPIQDLSDMFTYKKKLKKVIKKNTKDIFFIDGSLYMCKFNFFKKYKSVTNSKSKIYYVNQENSFDINNKFELELAKAYYLYDRLKKKNK